MNRFCLFFKIFILAAISCGKAVQEIDYNSPFDRDGTGCITHWEFVDGDPATIDGINYDPMRSGETPQLTVFNSKLYAAWEETNGTAFQIRVAVYNGNNSSPSWSFVDGNPPGATGLNYNNGLTANKPQLTVCNSRLYAIWRETDGTDYQVRVAVYNGDDSSPSWEFVDGGGNVGINYDTLQTVDNPPQITAFNSKLYATWSEPNVAAQQIRVKMYDGSNWSFVDGNPVTADGINYNPSNSAFDPSLTVYNSRLYATWRENIGTIQVRVAVYNGSDSTPSWTFVDGDPVSNDGINYDTLNSVLDPSQLVVCNSRLYAVWSEDNNYQVRVAAYNGNDSSPKWNFVDGNGINGLNYDPTESGRKPRITAYNSRLYTTWYESNYIPSLQLRIRVFNGDDSSPVWIFMEGKTDPACGINYMETSSAAYPQLTVFGSKLYSIWYEPNGGGNQVRVAVGAGD